MVTARKLRRYYRKRKYLKLANYFDMYVIFTYFAYHHLCCEFEPRSGEVYSIQRYGIKFISD